INGELDVGNANNGAHLVVVNGLVLNGTARVGNPTNEWYGGISFIGTQTLGGNGTVIFGNNSALCNTLRLENDDTSLTIGTGLTVRGDRGRIGYNPACWAGNFNHTVTNLGTIVADTAGGTIETRGQSFVNLGKLQAINGGHLHVLNLERTAGQMTVVGATLSLGGNWINTGVLNATNATVNLGGSFTLGNVGVFHRVGGAVNLTGTLEGGGGTLGLNALTGSWVMSGGTLRNLMVTATGGAQLISGNGTLDGVTINGELDVGNANNGAHLVVVNGLVLNGTAR